jgi:hypothetical protein
MLRQEITPTAIAVFIPSVVSSPRPFAWRHAEELLVAKVFFATIDSLEMETKASKTITLHEDGLAAAANLGFSLGVTLESLVDEREFGCIKKCSTGR